MKLKLHHYFDAVVMSMGPKEHHLVARTNGHSGMGLNLELLKIYARHSDAVKAARKFTSKVAAVHVARANKELQKATDNLARAQALFDDVISRGYTL